MKCIFLLLARLFKKWARATESSQKYSTRIYIFFFCVLRFLEKFEDFKVILGGFLYP